MVLLMSVPMQDRLVLIAGVVGFYTFAARLVFEVEDGALVALAFTLIGISLIVLGMGYQRIRRNQTLNLRWL